MQKFRKKPITIEAMYWDGERDDELLEWLQDGGCDYFFYEGRIFEDAEHQQPPSLRIRTLEGVMEVMPGDWIIKGFVNEFYPCRGDVFERTYEPVDALVKEAGDESGSSDES